MGECYKVDRCDDCYMCLKHIHSEHNKEDHYACTKITYNYILKHGHRYASEIAKAFYLLKPCLDLTSCINIYSVGCGPSTELYGAELLLKEEPFNYVGFDANTVWSDLQIFNKNNFSGTNKTVTFVHENFFDYIETHEEHIDILILNYFLSDIVKFTPREYENFLVSLLGVIRSGRISYLIINDVMLTRSNGTGYACMKEIEEKLKESSDFKFARYHFQDPTEYQMLYGEKKDNHLMFPFVGKEIEKYDPFKTCGSLLLLIKCELK